MSIRSKVALFFFGATLLVVLLFGGSIYQLVQISMERMIAAQMEDTRAYLLALWREEGPQALDRWDRTHAGRFWVAIDEGSHYYLNRLAKVAPLDLTETVAGSHRLLRLEGEKEVVLWMERYPFGANGVLYLGMLQDARIERILADIIYSLLVAAALLGVLAWLFTAFLMRPALKMAREVQEIGATRLDRRLSADSDDELGLLARRLNTLLERLERSFRHQNRFALFLSHEVKTPLAVMRSQMEQAIRDEAIPLVYKERFAAAIEAIARLNAFVETLLLKAGLDEGRVRPRYKKLLLKPMLLEIRELMEPLAEERAVTIAVEAAGDVAVMADETLLYRALLNLVDNAIAHSPKGKTVGIMLLRQPGEICIRIQDQGPGIPETAREAVFAPFYTVGREEGSGLGLALAASVVTAHDGAITIGDTPGGGAMITLCLPERSQPEADRVPDVPVWKG